MTAQTSSKSAGGGKSFRTAKRIIKGKVGQLRNGDTVAVVQNIASVADSAGSIGVARKA